MQVRSAPGVAAGFGAAQAGVAQPRPRLVRLQAAARRLTRLAAQAERRRRRRQRARLYAARRVSGAQQTHAACPPRLWQPRSRNQVGRSSARSLAAPEYGLPRRCGSMRSALPRRAARCRRLVVLPEALRRLSPSSRLPACRSRRRLARHGRTLPGGARRYVLYGPRHVISSSATTSRLTRPRACDDRRRGLVYLRLCMLSQPFVPSRPSLNAACRGNASLDAARVDVPESAVVEGEQGTRRSGRASALPPASPAG
jgi:hypothetical protein